MRKFGVASTVLVILTEGAVASVDFDSNLSEPKIRALRSHLQSFRRRGLHHATDSTADSAGLKTAAYHIYDRFERPLLFQRMAISYTVASAYASIP
jgi:hypothetical protein